MKEELYNRLLHRLCNNEMQSIWPVEFNDGQLSKFLQILNTDKNITLLSIGGRIEDEMCIKLINALQLNRNITYLMLINIDISTRNFEAIMNALNNSGIVRILIYRQKSGSQYRISQEKIIAFAKSLETNKTLISAEFTSLDISPNGMEAIASALDNNKTILKMYVSSTDMPELAQNNWLLFKEKYCLIELFIDSRTQLNNTKDQEVIEKYKIDLQHKHNMIDEIITSDLQILYKQLNGCHYICKISVDQAKTVQKEIHCILIDRAISKLLVKDSYLNRLPPEILNMVFRNKSITELVDIIEGINQPLINSVTQSINTARVDPMQTSSITVNQAAGVTITGPVSTDVFTTLGQRYSREK